MNMSYCRFHNTLLDLQQCYNALYDRDIQSEDEARYAERLISLCKDIVDNYIPEDAFEIYHENIDMEEE